MEFQVEGELACISLKSLAAQENGSPLISPYEMNRAHVLLMLSSFVTVGVPVHGQCILDLIPKYYSARDTDTEAALGRASLTLPYFLT